MSHRSLVFLHGPRDPGPHGAPLGHHVGVHAVDGPALGGARDVTAVDVHVAVRRVPLDAVVVTAVLYLFRVLEYKGKTSLYLRQYYVMTFSHLHTVAL